MLFPTLMLITNVAMQLHVYLQITQVSNITTYVYVHVHVYIYMYMYMLVLYVHVIYS